MTDENANHPPIGIDLGTTYSAVAYLDSTGRPTTIPNAEGDLLTPSAISFEDDNVVVGKEAVKASVFEPRIFADCFKRDMGRLRFRRAIGKHEVPPEVLSGFILERLKLDAEARLGPIRQVVITVPAFFDETRRRATQEAGRLAGLEVLDIINEPTAAAIAFGYYRAQQGRVAADTSSKAERVLVYDLGGGTFDATVLEVNGPTLRAIATDGDVQLGGRDFDERLVNHVAEKFLNAHGADPRSDPNDAAQLWLDVQSAKHALSARNKIDVPCAHAGIRMRVEVTRPEFEQLTSDLLERTESTTQVVVEQAKLTWDDIDRILLVGGASRMPMVLEMLRRVSGKEPDRSLSPDEAVAHGAAVYAGMLMGGREARSTSGLEVVNVNSHSLGIIGVDRRTNRQKTVVIIPKNTPLPCQAVRRFSTARDGQRNVKVAIVEGESERPEHCIALGNCVVRNLPPGLPKGTTVEVEYRYAANGRISVVARVPSARQSASVEIRHDTTANLVDLNTWRARLCGNAIAAATTSGDTSQPRDLSDQESSTKRLDDLLVKVGESSMNRPLPDTLQKSKTAALAATKERDAASANQRRVEARRETAIGQSEIIRATADVSQARAALQQAETKLRFAHLALGRECIAASLWPRELDAVAAEIQRLQRSVGVNV